MTKPIVLAALYRFTPMDDWQTLRPIYKNKMLDLGIKGTILLASEGVNGTVSGTREAMDTFISFLKSDPRLAELEVKESYFDAHPFQRPR